MSIATEPTPTAKLAKRNQLMVRGFQCCPVGMVANKTLSTEQREAAGEALAHIEGRLMWYIGDWLLAGERRGYFQREKLDESCERFGVAYSTASHAAATCKSLESCRRRQGAEANIGLTEKHYQTMPTETICAMDIESKAFQRQSDLFLWATTLMLPDAMHVMEAWGFEYKTNLVWDKERPYFGHYTHVRHEQLLLGTIGSCVPEFAKHQSVITVKKTRHSEKPSRFSEIILEMYPAGPYLELFARETRKGWSS